MESGQRERPAAASSSSASAGGETPQEYRVQVTTKKQVVEQMKKYKEILKTALDGQPDMAEEKKRALLEELLENFGAAVRVNVLVKGRPWEEAAEVEEDEALDLESLLDDTIVETTWRRRVYPKQILPHVVHSLKAGRKLMGLYERAFKHEEVFKDPDQESIMNDLSAEAPGMVKSAVQIIKAISVLQKQAEGLCEVLNTTPSRTTLEIHRAVFGCDGQSDPSAVREPARSRQPIKRALEEAAAIECYKKQPCAAGEGEPQ